MRTRIAYTRIVTLVTLIAMVAFGATSAFGGGTCMQDEAPAAEQPQHDHGAPHGSDETVPCQHAAQGGLCTSVTLPAAAVSFSVATPTTYVARVAEAVQPRSFAAAAVFHPPRF